MDKSIKSSVGQGGVNQNADVLTIQKLLNKVQVQWGGPQPLLAEDGFIGPKTIAAIRRFQEVQFKGVFQPDGKVDPGRMTLQRLNHIANSNERPTGSFRTSAEPVSHVRQPTNMTCWAAAGTMLCGARDHKCYEIKTIMKQADTADPGYGYQLKFNNDIGLPPADTRRYTKAIKLKVGPPVNFTVGGWRNLLSNHGAIGVVGLTPFLHIRVVTEIYGDGSVFGTWFKVRDPGMAVPYEELFITFAQKYENAANVNHKMDQIWHK